MIDTNDLNKLKIALNQIENGEDVHVAVANAEYVNYDQQLIDRINILKNISVLDTNILKYLYGIQLTDKIVDVAPKVNAIYQLALSAKLIEDTAIEEETQDEITKEENKEPLNFGKNETEIATQILKALLNINKKV